MLHGLLQAEVTTLWSYLLSGLRSTSLCSNIWRVTLYFYPQWWWRRWVYQRLYQPWQGYRCKYCLYNRHCLALKSWNPSHKGRFTKRLRELRNVSYYERLTHLGLHTLELHRLHLDLLFCYKIVWFGMTTSLISLLNGVGQILTGRGHRPQPLLMSEKFSLDYLTVEDCHYIYFKQQSLHTLKTFDRWQHDECSFFFSHPLGDLGVTYGLHL